MVYTGIFLSADSIVGCKQFLFYSKHTASSTCRSVWVRREQTIYTKKINKKRLALPDMLSTFFLLPSPASLRATHSNSPQTHKIQNNLRFMRSGRKRRWIYQSKLRKFLDLYVKKLIYFRFATPEIKKCLQIYASSYQNNLDLCSQCPKLF